MKFPTLLIVTVAMLATLNSPLHAQPGWANQIVYTVERITAVAFFDSTVGLAVGDNGIILRSSDRGVDWIATQVGSSPFSAISVASPGVALTANGGGCPDSGCGDAYRTSDFGTTWTHAASHGAKLPALSFAGPLRGILVGGGLNIGGKPYAAVEFTGDGGKTWDTEIPKYQGSSTTIGKIFTDVSFVDTLFCIAITADGAVLRLVDHTPGHPGGSVWNRLDSIRPGLRSVSFVDTTTGFIAGDGGGIWKTTDGGKHWQQQTSGTSYLLRSTRFLSATVGYIVGDAGTILFTSDGGNNWTAETTRTRQNLYDVFFTDSRHGWAVGDSGTILKYGEFSGCDITPRELDLGYVKEHVARPDSFYILNIGTTQLFFSRIVSDNPNFSTDVDSLRLPPGTLFILYIAFTPSSGGPQTGHIILTHNGPSSPDTLNVWGTGLGLDSTAVTLEKRWNIVSNPREVANDSAQVLFPTQHSSVFSYDPGVGYSQSKRITLGKGFWLKASGNVTAQIIGASIAEDTINVAQGWNLIGSLSYPAAVSAIQQFPAGIVISNYYSYTGSYVKSDSLQPGAGYWVKTTAPGKLVLSASRLPGSARAITPISDELPPPPPETAIETEEAPHEFSLEQNYPNPFNPATNFSFRIAESGSVKLSIYDVLGRVVATIVDENLTPGSYTKTWDAHSVASGLYYYRLTAGTFDATKKLMLVK